MAGLNKAQIIGRLGQDPEVRSTSGGTQVASISVATSKTWTKDGKKEEKTEWHRIILWGKLAELAGKYLKKGNQVYIEGELQTRSWDNNGQKMYTTEIVATNMVFLESANAGNRPAGTTAPAQGGSYNNDPMMGDDIPF